MDLMEELSTLLNTELAETSKGKGEPIRFSPEEYAKCKKEYIQFSKEESKLESIVRRERARVAARPDVYLTF